MSATGHTSKGKVLLAMALARDSKLGRLDLRIALYLLARASFAEWRVFSQQKIGGELAVAPNHVSQALLVLRKRKYIGRNERKSRREPYKYKLKAPVGSPPSA